MRLFDWLRRTRPQAAQPVLSPEAQAHLLLQKALTLATEADIRRLILGRNPQTVSDIDQTTYLQAYNTALWVNICTRTLADACASVPLKLRQKESGDEVEQHPLLDLLAYVNEEDDWPWFLGAMVSQRCLAGEAFIVLGGVGKQPDSLYLLRPDKMAPKTSGGQLTAWVYKENDVERTLPLEKVIQVKRWSPTNDLRGEPILRAGEISINLDLAVRKYNNNFLRQGAIPPFMLTAEGQLGEDEVRQIAQAWKAKHGNLEKAGEPFIHGSGLTLEILSDSTKEGSFTDLATLSKGEILALFGIPPMLVQDYSEASVLANADVQRQEFWRRTVLDGEMTKIIGVLNQELVPLYGSRDLELYADESAMSQLQEDETSRWERVSVAVGGPFLKVDEARKLVGLDPLEGGAGDIVYGLDEDEEPEPAVVLPEASREEEEQQVSRRALVLPVRQKSLVGGFGSDAHKAFAANFVDRLEPQITRMTETVSEINQGLLAEVLTNLQAEDRKGRRAFLPDFRRKAVVEEYLFDLNEAGDVYYRLLGSQEVAAVEDGAARTVAEVGGGVFSMEDPAISAFIAEKELAIRTLPETLYDTIAKELAAGVDAGETLTEIAYRLREMEPTLTRYYAERIARTEVLGASNWGSVAAMKQLGVEQKEWSSALDERTRRPANTGVPGGDSPFDHWSAHNEVVSVDQFFWRTGERLYAPGDPDGSAGNIINCRCAVIPVV